MVCILITFADNLQIINKYECYIAGVWLNLTYALIGWFMVMWQRLHVNLNVILQATVKELLSAASSSNQRLLWLYLALVLYTILQLQTEHLLIGPLNPREISVQHSSLTLEWDFNMLYVWLGNRTLAVCTKLDLMDHGTDALDILYGRGKSYIGIYVHWHPVNTATNSAGMKISPY